MFKKALLCVLILTIMFLGVSQNTINAKSPTESYRQGILSICDETITETLVYQSLIAIAQVLCVFVDNVLAALLIGADDPPPQITLAYSSPTPLPTATPVPPTQPPTTPTFTPQPTPTPGVPSPSPLPPTAPIQTAAPTSIPPMTVVPTVEPPTPIPTEAPPVPTDTAVSPYPTPDLGNQGQ